jgi:hypothetical protein
LEHSGRVGSILALYIEDPGSIIAWGNKLIWKN